METTSAGNVDKQAENHSWARNEQKLRVNILTLVFYTKI
jgi:hypothetical protein